MRGHIILRNNDLVSVALPIISAFAASTTVENKTVKNEKSIICHESVNFVQPFFRPLRKEKKVQWNANLDQIKALNK